MNLLLGWSFRLPAMFAVLAFVLLAPPAAAGDGEDYGTVVGVIWLRCYDGDTCTFNIPGWPAVVGERITVRIRGLDTPEVKGRCARERELAREARRTVVDALREATAIEFRRVGRDKYFRLLAEVWADGESVGDRLLARGLARPYDGGTKHAWCE